MPKAIVSKFQKQLFRRYLLWAYKTTREDFERIERKSTQIVVDSYIQNLLPQNSSDQEYDSLVKEFDRYIEKKREDEISLKFTSKQSKKLNGKYSYLHNRLCAIEAAIKHFLGKQELNQFEKMFEAEFTRRILESRDHS